MWAWVLNAMNCTPANSSMVNFMLCILYHNKKHIYNLTVIFQYTIQYNQITRSTEKE